MGKGILKASVSVHIGPTGTGRWIGKKSSSAAHCEVKKGHSIMAHLGVYNVRDCKSQDFWLRLKPLKQVRNESSWRFRVNKIVEFHAASSKTFLFVIYTRKY